MASPDELIAQFYHQQGKSFSDQKGQFYKLLKDAKLQFDNELLAADYLKPRNHLETVLYVDILIRSRKVDVLLEMLKSGNEIFVSKIVRQAWFVEEVFRDVSADRLVDEILPQMSYVVKAKVLKKILVVVSSERADEIFDALLQRYGLSFAKKTIQKCTQRKIESILKSYDVMLSTSDLKMIHKKNPDLIRIYYNELKKWNPEFHSDDNFLQYLAEYDTVLFWDMLFKYKVHTHVIIGRRNTRKIIQIKKKEVVQDPKTCLRYFREERVVRIINKSGQFPTLYKNLFPNDMNFMWDFQVTNILRHYPKSYRYNLYAETFEKVYNKDVWSASFCPDYFLRFIEDTNTRERWAIIKYEQQSNNNVDYLKYYPTNKCVQLVKDKLNITSNIHKRVRLLRLLPECCAINKDLRYLKEVLKYFCERHRNDDASARASFLLEIDQNFETEEFDDAIWKWIDEIFTIQHANKERDLTDTHSKLLWKYIEYVVNNGNTNEIDKVISKYVPKIIDSFVWEKLKELKNARVERQILLSSYKIVNKDNLSRLIGDILDYNVRHPQDRIDYSESLGESLTENIKLLLENQEKKASLFEKIPYIFYKNDDLYENKAELFNLYWENICSHWKSSVFEDSKFLFWCLKHKTVDFAQYFERIINAAITDKANFVICNILHRYRKIEAQIGIGRHLILSKFKRYDHLSLGKIIRDTALEQLTKNEDADIKENCIVALSYFLPLEEYIALMKEGGYVPKNIKIDTGDQKAVELSTLQKCFINSLKNTNGDPSKYLPMLLEELMMGDFVQSALRPLYSAFCRVSENELKNYLQLLLARKNLSIQKHAPILACSVFAQDATISTLKYFENADNVSLQKSVFNAALKYLSRNPSKQAFDVVKSFMKFILQTDRENLESLKSTKINREYKLEYLQCVSDVLGSLEDAYGKRSRCAFLKSLDQNTVEKLEPDFCKKLIQDNLLIVDPIIENLSGINLFTARFLCAHGTEENFQFVFSLLKVHKEKFWYDHDCRLYAQKRLCFFFTIFYNEATGDFKLDVLKKFDYHWKDVFSIVDSPDSHIKLTVLVFWKESLEFSTFALKFTDYLDDTARQYGHTLPLFVSSFLKLTDSQTDDEKLDLLRTVLKVSRSVSAYVLVISVIRIRGDFVCGNRENPKYGEINSLIKERTDSETVHMYYNMLLQNPESFQPQFGCAW